MTTGEPIQPRRVTWTEVHHKALRAAGYWWAPQRPVCNTVTRLRCWPVTPR